MRGARLGKDLCQIKLHVFCIICFGKHEIYFNSSNAEIDILVMINVRNIVYNVWTKDMLHLNTVLCQIGRSCRKISGTSSLFGESIFMSDVEYHFSYQLVNVGRWDG